jgi:hypothetical protein
MEHWEPKLEEVWQANLAMKYHMNYRLVLLDNLMITTRHARASALCSSTVDSNYMSLAPRSSRQGKSHSAPHLRNHRLRVASIGDRGLEKALWVYFAIEEIMVFTQKIAQISNDLVIEVQFSVAIRHEGQAKLQLHRICRI